jgi:hypothetical protein
MPLEGDQHSDDTGNTGEYKPSTESSKPSEKLPSGGAPSEPPQTPCRYDPREKTARKWKENTKLGLEIGGLAILLVYTIFSALQWAQLRWTNRLTRDALKDNGTSLQATLNKMQGQTDATNRLYAEAQKQTSSAGTMATNSGRQAAATERAATAAKSAADTAKDTLHMSEGANLVVNAPKVDLLEKSIRLPVQNIGRLPAREVVIVAHEATIDYATWTSPIFFANAAEIHWHRNREDSITTSDPVEVVIPITNLNSDRLTTGYETIIVVGFMTYSDGFSDTPQQRWDFCFQTQFQTTIKKSLVVGCSAKDYLPRAEQSDGYPSNEQK